MTEAKGFIISRNAEFGTTWRTMQFQPKFRNKLRAMGRFRFMNPKMIGKASMFLSSIHSTRDLGAESATFSESCLTDKSAVPMPRAWSPENGGENGTLKECSELLVSTG